MILNFIDVLLLTSLTLAPQATNIEENMIDYGMVNVCMIDPTIKVRLVYSTTDNFVKADMYGDFDKAYLAPEIATMVAKAQKELKAINPTYSLIILDAARPISVQQRMFKLVAGTPLNIYVANPAKGGGRHNYGTAVDITIVDKNGKELDMGSPFDYFGETSHVGSEQLLLKNGKITNEAYENRTLLTQIMKSVGFTQHPKEWWHFHKYTINELKSNFKLLNF